MTRWQFKKTERDMFGDAIDENTTSPGQAASGPDGASASRDRGDGIERSADLSRNLPTLGEFGLGGWMTASQRARASAEEDAQRARAKEWTERAAKLEKAAEHFRLAGDEKTAASFAEQAAELRRAGF